MIEKYCRTCKFARRSTQAPNIIPTDRNPIECFRFPPGTVYNAVNYPTTRYPYVAYSHACAEFKVKGTRGRRCATIEQGLKALKRLDLQEYPSHAGKGAVEDIALARAALLDAQREIKVRDEAMLFQIGDRVSVDIPEVSEDERDCTTGRIKAIRISHMNTDFETIGYTVRFDRNYIKEEYKMTVEGIREIIVTLDRLKTAARKAATMKAVEEE